MVRVDIVACWDFSKKCLHIVHSVSICLYVSYLCNKLNSKHMLVLVTGSSQKKIYLYYLRQDDRRQNG